MWTMAAIGKRPLSRTTRVLQLTNPNRDIATSVRSRQRFIRTLPGLFLRPQFSR
jgi:hypothetical protein